ncbi:MAG: thiamine diphosphokinase [Spirochaetales bacterium]|jgi:thiamine pyrophosphokinase|nr:thiamine diphosphokinase [Spirochaetales bacterium]
MKGLVFTGGAAPGEKVFEALKGRFDFSIAADSGYNTAVSIGAEVDYIVGDMDSISSEKVLSVVPPEKIIRYKVDKDETDTEIAVRHAREAGCGFVCIYGGGGGRLDHLIGIFSLFERENPPNMWVTDSDVVVLINSEFVLRGMKNTTISFFPAGQDACTMQTGGLKWNLNKLRWEKGDCGMSNVVVENEMKVEMKTGRLLLIGPLELLRGMDI